MGRPEEQCTDPKNGHTEKKATSLQQKDARSVDALGKLEHVEGILPFPEVGSFLTWKKH